MVASSSSLGITGLGMHTSLGGAVQAAAAFRAGIARTVELESWPYFDDASEDPVLLLGHAASGVTEGFQGQGRLLRLVDRAFEDLRTSVSTHGLDPARTGVFIVLPRPRAGRPEFLQEPQLAAQFAARIRDVADIPCLSEHVRCFAEGRVGMCSAVSEAIQTLDAGQWHQVFVIAVDSLLDSEFLTYLVSKSRVKSIEEPTGLMPGEAACVVRLERTDNAANTLLTTIHAPVRTEVDVTRHDRERLPQTGREMAQALLGALERASASKHEIGDFYSDANGEVHRASELSGALLYLSQRGQFSSWRDLLPAMSFGDTGAACGLLLICLATRAFARNHASGRFALISLASDGPARAGVLLEGRRNGSPSL